MTSVVSNIVSLTAFDIFDVQLLVQWGCCAPYTPPTQNKFTPTRVFGPT